MNYMDGENFVQANLRAVGVLLSPMVSRWAGGRKKFVRAVSETVRCRKLILGRDIA